MKFTSTAAIVAAVATGAVAYRGAENALEGVSSLTNCTEPFESFANCTIEDLKNRTTITKETKRTFFGNVTIEKITVAPSNGTVCVEERTDLGVCLADSMGCGDQFKAVAECEAEKYSQGNEVEVDSNSTDIDGEDETPEYMMNPQLLYLDDPCRDVKMDMYKCLMKEIEDDFENALEARQSFFEAEQMLQNSFAINDQIGYYAIQVNASNMTDEMAALTNETMTLNAELEEDFPELMDSFSDYDMLDMEGQLEETLENAEDAIEGDMDYVEAQFEEMN